MAAPELSLDQTSLQHRLNDLPADIRPHIKMGFGLLTRIGKMRREKLRDYIISSMAESKEIESAVAEEISQLNGHTIGDVLTASTFAIASTLDLDVSDEDFVRFSPDDLLNPEDSEAVRDILQGLNSRRAELKSAFDASSLARSILPSVRGFSLQLDLRVKFDEASNEITTIVPVAICRLHTDTEEANFYFQADADDIDRLIKSLEKARERMDQLKRARVDL